MDQGLPGYEPDGEEIQCIKANAALALLFLSDPDKCDL